MPSIAINITLSQELIDEANGLDMDLALTCEQLLTGAIRAAQERRWATEHRAYVAAYNATVDSEGLPLASSRSF